MGSLWPYLGFGESKLKNMGSTVDHSKAELIEAEENWDRVHDKKKTKEFTVLVTGMGVRHHSITLPFS